MKTKRNQLKKTKNSFSRIFYLCPILILIITVYSCDSDPSKIEEKSNLLQGNGYGINSAIFSVTDIDSTNKYLSEKLGFSFLNPKPIEKGMIEGTLSSTIDFPDMSSLQLFTVSDTIPVTSKDSIMRDYLNQKEGLRMYSISSSSAESTNNWLVSQGFVMDSVNTYLVKNRFSRDRAWDLNFNEIKTVSFTKDPKQDYLPFFAQKMSFPYSRMHEWDSFYNMGRGFMRHPNGVVGINSIQLHVKDIEVAKNKFRKMGLTELDSETSTDDTARFKVKRNQIVEIVTANTDDDESIQLLGKGNSKIIGIGFDVKSLEETHSFLQENLSDDVLHFDSITQKLKVVPEELLGVHFEFTQEPEEQALLAEKLNLNYGSKLDSIARSNADTLYQKYCALCHGENRQGYTADNAPSLRSKSLLASSKGSNFLRYTIQYGRAETAMAGYYDELGGPLTYLEIELILKWLEEEAGIEEAIEISREPVSGDIDLGKTVYDTKCASCHGFEGEGITAPALGHPMLLATATDEFIRYAIQEGRDGTPMIAYKDSLSNEEIDGVTAFIRSRASGWNTPKLDSITEPKPEDYVLNPDGEAPNFTLRDGRYVSAKQVSKALKDSSRLVILDARSKVAWRQTHIPGAIPVPYYDDPEEFTKHVPNDDNTMIVVYCACPHAASGTVVDKLNKIGYKNAAILDEGILVWAQQGHQVSHGN